MDYRCCSRLHHRQLCRDSSPTNRRRPKHKAASTPWPSTIGRTSIATPITNRRKAKAGPNGRSSRTPSRSSKGTISRSTALGLPRRVGSEGNGPSIDAMADAGIDAIIFDWYRYDDDIDGGVMIEEALRKGFLQAPNRNRVKFALMWANHTYIDCHPLRRASGSTTPLYGGRAKWAGLRSSVIRKMRSSPTSSSRTTGRSTAGRISRSTNWTSWSRVSADWRRRAPRCTTSGPASRPPVFQTCT